MGMVIEFKTMNKITNYITKQFLGNNKMKKTLLASVLAATTLVSGYAQAEWSANVAATSNYLWRGFEQTGGDAAVSGGVDYAAESGFYAGTWVSNASWADGMTYELDLYAGYGGEINGIGYDIGYIYYAYPDETSGDADFSEVYLNLSKGNFTFGIAVLSSASGENSSFGDTLYLSADYGVEVGNGAELGFHVGSYSGDWLAEDTIDLGLTLSKDAFTFGLSKIDAEEGDDLKAYVSYAVDFEL